MGRNDGNFRCVFIEFKAHMKQPSGDIQEASEIRAWKFLFKTFDSFGGIKE